MTDMPREKSPRLRALIAIVGFTAAFAIGLLGWHMSHDPTTHRALPPTGEALTVLSPYASGDEFPEFPASSAADAAVPGANIPSGGTAARFEPIRGRTTPTPTTGTAPTTATTGPTPATGAGAPPATPLPPAPAPASDPRASVEELRRLDLIDISDPPYHLVDLCADARWTDCPDGIGGTILRSGIEPLVIRQVTTDVTPGRPGLYDECVRTLGAPTRERAFLAIISNHPAGFGITGAWTATADTSIGQRNRSQVSRAAGDTTQGVVTCAELSPVGRTGEITVKGNDGLGPLASFTQVVTAHETTRGRPPTSLTPTGLSSLRVAVPLRPNEEAEVVAYRRSGGGGSLCRPPAAHTAPPSESYFAVIQRSVVSVADLFPGRTIDPLGSFDPAWSRYAVVDLRLLGGTATYDVCIRWSSRQRSFDPLELLEIEDRVVMPPARNEVRFSIQGIGPALGHTIDPAHIRLEVLPSGRTGPSAPLCTREGSPAQPFPVDPRTSGQYWFCEAHGADLGDVASVRVAHGRSEVVTLINVATRGCISPDLRTCTGMFSEFYTARVPEVGNGDAGVVFLEVEYTAPTGGLAGGGRTADDWVIPDGVPIPVPRLDWRYDLPPQPRLDLFRTTVAVEGGAEGQDTVVLNWFADRPVTAEFFVESNDRHTCQRAVVARVATPNGEASEGTLRLRGLCAGTRHNLGVHLHDTAGGTDSTYSNLEGVHADRIGPGFEVVTAGVPARFRLEVRLVHPEMLPAGSTLRLDQIIAQVAGGRVFGSTYSRLLPGPRTVARIDELRCVADPAAWRHPDPGVPAAYRTQEQPLPPDVEVVVDARFIISSTACGVPNADLLRRNPTDRHMVTVQIHDPLATPDTWYGDGTEPGAVQFRLVREP